MKKIFLLLLLLINVNIIAQTQIYNLQTGIVSSPINFGLGIDAGTITCNLFNQSGNSGTCVNLRNARTNTTTSQYLTVRLTGDATLDHIELNVSSNSGNIFDLIFQIQVLISYEYSSDSINWGNGQTIPFFSYLFGCQPLVTITAPPNTKYCRFSSNATARYYTITIFKKDCPTTTTWNGSINSDWTNSENWSDGYPCPSTDVIIPSISTNYPIISSSVSCKNITFEPNAGVLGLQNLIYEKAFVKLTVSRDKYYCLVAPLKEMYSGDYYFNGSPESYMNLFDTYSPDVIGPKINYIGKFTRSFINLQVPLTNEDGFAFKVSKKTWNYPNGFSDINTDMTITFPRINTDSSLVTTYIPYSGFNGIPYTFLAKSVIKDNFLAYRFNGENASNKLTNKTKTLQSGLTLLGNPIMSHLNINEFLSSNSSVISNNIKLWNGSSYQTYDASTGLWDGTSTGNYIAPMQSFIVNSNSGGDITFDLSAHYGIPDGGSILRSAKIKNNILKILATKDSITTGTIIIKDDNANNDFDNTDIPKLFTSETNVADAYSVSNDKALAFNKFNKYPFIVPIGFKSSNNGVVNIDINGAESFTDANVYLINTLTGEEIDLKQTTSYDFNLINDGIGTLFIQFRNTVIKTEPINDQLINFTDSIHITSIKKTINITSSINNLINDIFVYDCVGHLIKEIRNVNCINYQLIGLSSAVYIINVGLKNICIKKKILIN